MLHTDRRTAALCFSLVLSLTACGGGSEPESPTPRPAPTAADSARAEEPGILGTPTDSVRVPEPRPEPVRPPAPQPKEPAPEPVPERPAERAPEITAPAKRPRAPVPTRPNSILPRQRIVAFYGTPTSKRMGILGELPPGEMLDLLDREVDAWRAADPLTPVVPALHLIAVMATGDPGPDGMYRLRMPDRVVDRVVEWADQRDAIVFLDIQPGLADPVTELPRLEPWLKRPDVHLALDPEWAMPPGTTPGKRIGTLSAREVNEAIDYLAGIVEKHGLPPKVLVVHRFTQGMIRGAEDIRTDPRVQVVINMDGWGPPSQKIRSYRDFVVPEATQWTGFKLFYKNDRKGNSRMLTPAEILQLDPVPVYIQYQ